VFLMLPSDRFVAGLGHVPARHVGTWSATTCTRIGARARSLRAVVAVAAVVVGTPVARGAASSGGARLAGPVVVYMVVISAMVVSAVAAGPWLAGAGAVLFFVSDGLIAWNRFVAPLRRAPVAIMVTYHLGQAGLVLSLAT